MIGSARIRFSSIAVVCWLALLASTAAHAASKAVDLDGNTANGAESVCELNVLQTFPVMIENKVTNKAGGDAFAFVWPSAGPGGFSSSVTAGTTGGVGAKWVWTTNQSVYSYTGNSCDNDICFNKLSGPDILPGFCNYACLVDPTSITLTKGATGGGTVLTWTGGQGPFTIYRATNKAGLAVPSNAIGTTDALTFTDTPSTNTADFYSVRGVCTSRKPCSLDADCSVPGDGMCVSRGPFGVPGRSLFSNNVTVSAASLTSSLITFFSPPKEIFRVTSTAGAGGVAETVTNTGTTPVFVTTPAYPEGCCEEGVLGPHQLRCGDECVAYLTDPHNCGACGNECGDGNCCSNGVCTSLCASGDAWCGEECADVQNDDNNCGACGTVCGDGTCCAGGACASLCPDGQVWCDNACVDFDNDSAHCGACGVSCGSGTCCDGGACVSVCPAGQVWCNESCVDFQNDSANCGACGSSCGEGTCCTDGTCESFCPEGQVLCGTQCVDFENDSANCGACGLACGEGSCCNDGACENFCAEGEVIHDNYCIDLSDDNNNCGDFGVVCAPGTCCNDGLCYSGCPPGRTLCNGACVDLESDPNNCGTCAHDCQGSGNACVGGACANGAGYDPTRDPSPTPVVCPILPPPPPVPAKCHNATPSSPTPGYCHNEGSSNPTGGTCPNTTPSSPQPGYCPNSNPASGTVAGTCPEPSGPPPTENETAICTVPEHTTEIPGCVPGSAECPTATVCTPGGKLFKEVPTQIQVCGDGIPGVDGLCNNSATKVTTGTFNRLVPVAGSDTAIGNAYVTPYYVHVVADSSDDGLIEPGETASLVIEALNAGPLNITNARATLTAPSVDLTDDNCDNPVGIYVSPYSVSYGTILGTPAAADCTPPTLHPASNVTVFQITVPSSHPGDTSHPLNLNVTGTVNGAPFSMSVPVVIGIADKCDAGAHNRDFDGLDGLSSPMKKLVPVGETVPKAGPFTAGSTRPLKLRVYCGYANLDDNDIDAPEIIGLSEATRGELDIHALNLNADNTSNPNDPFFRFGSSSLHGGQWTYNMRTSLIGTGTFTLKIRIGGRKEYVTGFILNHDD
jgi:hypothetical protein